MQKYIAQHLSQDTGQEHGGRRMLFGPESVYLAKDVEPNIAAKDRDLADANHALLLANNSADAFKRVAEQRQGEIERLRAALEDTLECNDNGRHCDVCHTNTRAALRPNSGASNG